MYVWALVTGASVYAWALVTGTGVNVRVQVTGTRYIYLGTGNRDRCVCLDAGDREIISTPTRQLATNFVHALPRVHGRPSWLRMYRQLVRHACFLCMPCAIWNSLLLSWKFWVYGMRCIKSSLDLRLRAYKPMHPSHKTFEQPMSSKRCLDDRIVQVQNSL